MTPPVQGPQPHLNDMPSMLDRLFGPGSVAIIGASPDTKTISGQPLKYLIAQGYRGRIYPVNPRRSEVLGLACYPSVDDLPEVPDLALIVVAAHRVPDCLRSCGVKGIPFAIIVSSGFAETDDAGRALQAEVEAIASRYAIGVIGPNCQGMLSVSERMAAGFGTPFQQTYREGPVSLVSQSGGFGGAMLMLAHEEGLGFRHFVTTGNECGISSLDLIDYFCADDRTMVIAAYVEGMKDAGRLIEVGRRALAARKPLLIWKAGNTEVGARAAASHTANMTGSSALYGAALRQIGAIDITDVADLADFAKAFIPQRLPLGSRVAVVTTSGGAGIVMADIYSQAGMEIPALSAQSLAQLKVLLPRFASTGNPIDTTAGVIDGPERLREALAVIAADPNIDCISLACAALYGSVGLHLAEAVCAVYRETKKPILLAWNAPEELAGDAYAMVDREGIPRFRTPVRCARAMAKLCEFAAALAREEARGLDTCMTIDRPDARDYLRDNPSGLTEHAAKGLLANYGIPVTREDVAHSKAQALQFAEELGYPLVMKVHSAVIAHKTEIGGVRLGLMDGEAVAAAWDEIMENVLRHLPAADIEGVLIQEQVPEGIELIVGIHNDPLFGPAVMLGLGGIYAEVMGDVSVRVAPIGRLEALSMIRELKAYPILDGARGRPKADIDALADVLVRVSAMAIDLRDELSELDINPLFVFPAGLGVKAADALIRSRGGPHD